MTFKTKFIDKGELQDDLLETIREIIFNYNKIEVVLSENLYPLDKDSYQFVVRMLNKMNYRDRIKCTFSSILLKEMYRAEILSAGSGQIAFLFALNLLKNLLLNNNILYSNGNEAKLMKDWEAVLEKVKAIIENCSTVVSEDILRETITNICGENKNLSTACFEALNLAGLEGKVFIENGKQENYVIELKEGYSFNLQPYKFFLDTTTGSWKQKQCKILVVDGLVEKVSEIDHLLNEAFETKQPMVFMAQGFSEEIVSTLYLNFKKKLINVIPIRIRPDISSLNVVNDIGIVCGSLPISSLQGQMISCVKYEDIPTVNKIMVTEKKTTIENPKTHRSVSDQIRMLLTKREDYRLQEDIQNVIDQRIRSLVPNSVLLQLPEMSSVQNDAYRVKLDRSLRSCKTILNYGIAPYVEVENSIKSITSTNDLEKILFVSARETLSELNNDNRSGSILSLYLGLLFGGKITLMIYSSGGLVGIDLASPFVSL